MSAPGAGRTLCPAVRAALRVPGAAVAAERRRQPGPDRSVHSPGCVRPARSGLGFPTECPRGARRADLRAAAAATLGAPRLPRSGSGFGTARPAAPGHGGSARGRVSSAGHDPALPRASLA